MRIRTVLWLIGIVYLLNWLIAFTGLPFKYEWVDVPFHFIGGFLQALLAITILASGKVQNLPKWHTFFFVVGFAAIISVCWEIIEYLQMYFFPANKLFIDLTVRDIMGDFVNDGLGAIAAWAIFKKLIHKTN